jgi:hypothetical protein
MKNFNTQSVVAHPVTKEVFKEFVKDGKTFATVRVDETTMAVTNGFTSMRKRTAFVTLGDDVYGILKPMIVAGQPYPLKGKIVVKEFFEPQWDGHEPKMNPRTEEIISVDGKPVYRTSDFSTDMEQPDVLLYASATATTVDSAEAEADVTAIT